MRRPLQIAVAALLLTHLPAEVSQAGETRPPEMVNLLEQIPNLRWNPIYATPKNITGKPLYPQNARPWATPEVAAGLRQASKILEKHGYGITITDAYRPLSVTIKLWNAAIAAQLPPNSFADPRQGSDHNRGAAVDLHLHSISPNKPDPPLPSPIDTKITKPLSPKQKEHQNLLKQTMAQCGFTPHRSEWWHFSIPNNRPPGDWAPKP